MQVQPDIPATQSWNGYSGEPNHVHPTNCMTMTRIDCFDIAIAKQLVTRSCHSMYKQYSYHMQIPKGQLEYRVTQIDIAKKKRKNIVKIEPAIG